MNILQVQRVAEFWQLRRLRERLDVFTQCLQRPMCVNHCVGGSPPPTFPPLSPLSSPLASPFLTSTEPFLRTTTFVGVWVPCRWYFYATQGTCLYTSAPHVRELSLCALRCLVSVGLFFQRKGETAAHAGAGGSTSPPTQRDRYTCRTGPTRPSSCFHKAILSGLVPRGSRDSTAHHSQRELAAIGMETSHALSDVKLLRSVDQRQTGSSSCRRGQICLHHDMQTEC